MATAAATAWQLASTHQLMHHGVKCSSQFSLASSLILLLSDLRCHKQRVSGRWSTCYLSLIHNCVGRAHFAHFAPIKCCSAIASFDLIISVARPFYCNCQCGDGIFLAAKNLLYCQPN